MASNKGFFGKRAVDEAVAGFCAGAVSTLLLHPLDVVRIRLQIQNEKQASKFNRPYYTGTIHAFRTIYATESWRAFYQGLSPNFVGATLSWGLYFFWYDIIKTYRRKSSDTLSPSDYMIAAAEAGALTSVVTNPIWLIKTRMAMQLHGHPDSYKGLFDGLIRVSREEGIRGLYKGFVPSLFGTLHGSIQFVAYEYMKKWFQDDRQNNKLSVPQYLLIASTSKIIATCATYPFQVVRSRLQDQRGLIKDSSQGYTGVWDTTVKMARYEGVYGFYRGMVPSIVRVLPATCITFVVYEQLVNLFKDQVR